MVKEINLQLYIIFESLDDHTSTNRSLYNEFCVAHLGPFLMILRCPWRIS